MGWREWHQGRNGRPAAWVTVISLISAALAGAAAAAAGAPAAAAPAQGAVQAQGAGALRLDGDGPPGFWFGTDSRTVAMAGSPAQWAVPVTGGYYGGYVGMTGNWANLAGCHKIVVWSDVNAAQARADYTVRHEGIGTGVYWFMGGPGVDPRYNGTAGEAYAWGARQAARAVSDIAKLRLTYPVVFMDIEIPGDAPDYTPAPDNGWNTVYTRACSGVARAHYIPAVVDRADVNGFAAYLASHSAYKAGVYSAPGIWASIFGTGSAASIPGTYEWTYEPFTSSLARPPLGWCLRGTATCARFFGGITATSKYAVMWQWSGGGGSSNGHGDFDQIDATRTP